MLLAVVVVMVVVVVTGGATGALAHARSVPCKSCNLVMIGGRMQLVGVGSCRVVSGNVTGYEMSLYACVLKKTRDRVVIPCFGENIRPCL